MKIALQMYTLRNEIKDADTLMEALRKVKAMGYEGVEFAGYHGVAPEKLAETLRDLGLTAVCCHEPIDRLEQNLEEAVDSAARLGLHNMAMAYSPANSPEELDRTLRVMKDATAAAAARGITVLYHNHDHEFREVGGRLPVREIMAASPLEMDSYWVFFAGEDAAGYLRANNSKIGLLHLKDGGKDKPSPCALGEGENDMAGIVRAACDLGLEWMIVENDDPKPDGFSDAQRSMEWLKKQLA